MSVAVAATGATFTIFREPPRLQVFGICLVPSHELAPLDLSWLELRSISLEKRLFAVPGFVLVKEKPGCCLEKLQRIRLR